MRRSRDTKVCLHQHVNLASELCSSQELSEDISRVLACVDVLDVHVTSLNSVSDEVVLNIDVLRPPMKDMLPFIASVDHTSIILVEQQPFARDTELVRQAMKKQALTNRFGRCNIFSFG